MSQPTWAMRSTGTCSGYERPVYSGFLRAARSEMKQVTMEITASTAPKPIAEVEPKKNQPALAIVEPSAVPAQLR